MGLAIGIEIYFEVDMDLVVGIFKVRVKVRAGAGDWVIVGVRFKVKFGL